MDHNNNNSTNNTALFYRNQCRWLDQLYATDAILSITFGIVSLLTPHIFIVQLTGSDSYNHSVHETLRLYACLRIALGYILWHVRTIDDGIFRKHICEILFICYLVQALVVVRAQFTDRHVYMNWMAIIILTTLSIAYGNFRFRKGGNLIKIYELPSSVIHQ